MKTAREMFKELGFVNYNFEDEINYQNEDICVRFLLTDKEYHCFIDEIINGSWERSDISVDIDLHKAINQQLKELGWLDEE